MKNLISPHKFANEENGLKFLDLKTKYLNCKLFVEVYSKSTNSLTWAMPSSWFLMKKVPQWISIRPQRIYNTTEEHESCANEFNNY